MARDSHFAAVPMSGERNTIRLRVCIKTWPRSSIAKIDRDSSGSFTSGVCSRISGKSSLAPIPVRGKRTRVSQDTLVVGNNDIMTW